MTHMDEKIDLDLRGSACPMAFVKFRLFADAQSNGTVFTLLFENTPANEPLVRSISSLGHEVIMRKEIGTNTTTPNATAAKIALLLVKVQVNK